MARDYIIGGQKIEGIALSGVRAAGEIAAINIARAREQNQSNPYTGQIQSPDTSPDAPLYTSQLGTPVYADITFGDRSKGFQTYSDSQGNIVTIPILTLYAVLIDLNFPRNIVKTAIQGRNGTVKEYIGEDDAIISFRGVITGANGQYPVDDVETLKKIIQAPVAIPVVCTYLNNFGINSIVFETRTLNQEAGGYSYQPFSLDAISDTPQELLIMGL